MSFILLNPQVEAPSELTANERYWESLGKGPTWRWQSERRMYPMNTRGDPVGQAQAIARAFPGIRRIRMPFNKNFFGRPEFPGMHPDLSAWIKELVAQGFRFTWVQMDGPSQEAGSGGEWEHYPLMYPGEWPETETLDQWRAWMGPGGRMSDRHIENFQAMWNWVQANTPDMIIDGYEAINEPVSYRRPGSMFGSAVDPEFMGYYVDHCLRIYDWVQARDPGKQFYIDGWSYATDFENFRTVKMPAYGGKTALEVFRERIPSGRNGQLTWSIHLYFDWMGTPYSHKALRAELDRRWGHLFQDRVVITETSLSDSSDDWRFNEALDFNRWFLARVGDWYRDRDVGLGWFTALNYGPGKLITVFSGGEISIEKQDNFANFWNLACQSDRSTNLTLAEKSGPQPLHRVAAVRGLRNQAYEPDAGTTDPAQAFTLGFGGRGVCVLTGQDDANNFLYGGPGRTILYGGALDNYLYLGTGGGVMRGGARNNTFGTNGGDNRIYTGPGGNLVVLTHGRSDVICDPAGVTRIFGFDPVRGDRLSFKGAFSSPAAMDAGAARVASGSVISGATNVEITTPQGGKVVLLHQGQMIDLLRFYVADFQDSWYSAGWSEPVDYTTSEFATPMAPIPPIVLPTTTAPPTGITSNVWTAFRQSLTIRDAMGRPVGFKLAV